MKNVLVTGANGHLGYNLVHELVNRGYSVRAGVRDITNKEKHQHLVRLANVTLVQANILDLDEMVEASRGCDGIFHVAAVFAFAVKNPEEEIIKPAIEGTLNALKAARQNQVKKVVLTSSSLALGLASSPDKPLNPDSWNTQARVPYTISKVRSEQAAWDYARKHGINMVSVNPGFILGPGFYRVTPSVKVVKDIMHNSIPVRPPLNFNVVDVRDVVQAHILVYENPTSGRYIAATQPLALAELMESVQEYHADARIPRVQMNKGMFIAYSYVLAMLSKITRKPPLITTKQAREYTAGKRWTDNSALESLGWRPRPLGESVKDTVDWINQHSF